jgi:UDP-2,3-diacylglucosamine pyrophosphatase LpxH
MTAPRLQIVSDLHLEFQPDGGRHLLERRLELDPAADAVVLAGDIGVAGRHRATLDRALQFFSSRFRQVFFVPGNHELYGTRVPEAEAKLRKLVGLYPRVTLLEPGVVGRWGDRRVVGATLWFPRYSPGMYETDLTAEMSDFSAIKNFRSWVYRKNEEHERWLREAVCEGDVVVTHHIPSARSVPAKHARDPLNVFFVCDQEALIRERRPALWVHGHTHESFRYQIGPTTILCNPLGYWGEENPAFATGVWDG